MTNGSKNPTNYILHQIYVECEKKFEIKFFVLKKYINLPQKIFNRKKSLSNMRNFILHQISTGYEKKGWERKLFISKELYLFFNITGSIGAFSNTIFQYLLLNFTFVLREEWFDPVENNQQSHNCSLDYT